jgi:hypothetical protein
MVSPRRRRLSASAYLGAAPVSSPSDTGPASVPHPEVTMPRWLRLSLVVLVAVVVLIQFVPVERSNPPETAPLVAPTAVTAVLAQSCFDCHSHRTVWPWYARVAPVSWLVAHDVEEGREHLNFSTWASLSAAEQNELLAEIWEDVSEGEMPPGNYVLLHGEAVLTEADLAALRDWVGDAAAAAAAAAEEHDHDDH